MCDARDNPDLREIHFNHFRNYFSTVCTKLLIFCIFSYSSCILGRYGIVQCTCQLRNLQMSWGSIPFKCQGSTIWNQLPSLEASVIGCLAITVSNSVAKSSNGLGWNPHGMANLDSIRSYLPPHLLWSWSVSYSYLCYPFLSSVKKLFLTREDRTQVGVVAEALPSHESPSSLFISLWTFL